MTASDLTATLKRLDSELNSGDTGLPETVVIGDVPEAPKFTLGQAYLKAKTKVFNYLLGHSLKPHMRSLQHDVPLFIKRMDPENGLTEASTNGSRIEVNEYVIPATAMFSRLMGRLEKSDGRFAKYLHARLSDAVNNLTKTLSHELTHVYQIKTGMAEDIFEATKNYIKSRIPKYAEPLAGLLACYFFRPPIEGLTEATVDQMYGSHTPWEMEDKAKRDPSLYSWYKGITAKTLKDIGDKMPSDIYAESMYDGGAKRYTNTFLEKYGVGEFLKGLFGSRPHAMDNI